MSGAPTAAELRQQVDGRAWYHTLELAPGLLTPGWFDLRRLADELLPTSLAGRRCLDVGTFDGFWAFEMERRGAAEVLATDLLDPGEWDWPANASPAAVAAIGERKSDGGGFELARRALGSSVERRELSVYDLDRDELGGFDFVYVGSLLLHLRDPVRALAAVRSVCDGEAVVVDAIDLPRTLLHPRRPFATLDGDSRPWWWKPNLAGLARLAESAGLELARPPRRIRMPAGAGQARRLRSPRLLGSAGGRETLARSWLGDPHGVVIAHPAPGR